MNRTQDNRTDLLSGQPPIPPAETREAPHPPLPATNPQAGHPRLIDTKLTSEDGFSDEIIETQSDVFDLAIQEAIRASTPKRRDIKLRKTQGENRRQSTTPPGTETTFCPVPPPWTIEEILSWANAYYEQHGRWPTRESGTITDAPDETWAKVNNALMVGGRSLPHRSSLAKLLLAHRNVRR